MNIFFLVGICLGLKPKLQLPLTVPECNGVVYERPDIHQMTDQEWDRFTQVVFMIHGDNNAIEAEVDRTKDPTRVEILRGLKAKYGESLYDQMVEIHVKGYEFYHDTLLFLAWHRAFLLLFEKELQRVDPSVRLPFWDFTVYHDRLDKDPALSTNRLGGNGQPPNYFVDNPFQKLFGYFRPANSQNRLHYTTRNTNFTKHRPIAPVSLMVNHFSRRTLELFHAHLETTIHGNVHMAIGKEFFSHSSPNDIIFFPCHAAIDKFWFIWQNMHNNFRYPASFHKTVMETFGILVTDILDPRKKGCSVYKESHYFYNGSVKGVPDQLIHHLKKSEKAEINVDHSVEEQYREVLKAFHADPSKFPLANGELNPSTKNMMYNQTIINQDNAQDLAIEMLAQSEMSHSLSLSTSSLFPISLLLLIASC